MLGGPTARFARTFLTDSPDLLRNSPRFAIEETFFRTRAQQGEALHMDKNSDCRVGYRPRRGRGGLSLIDGYHLA